MKQLDDEKYLMSENLANEIINKISSEDFKEEILFLLRNFNSRGDHPHPDSRYLKDNLRKIFQKIFDPEYNIGNIGNNLYFEQFLMEDLALHLRSLYASDSIVVSKDDIQDSVDDTLGIQYENGRIVQLASVDFYVR